MSKLYVKDLHDKDQVKSVFQVGKKATVTSKSGKPFLALTLRDKTGELDARIWDKLEALEPLFQKGDLIEVEGEVQMFQGRPQLKIDNLSKHSGEGFDPAEFAAPPRPQVEERSFAQIVEMVDRLHDPHVKALCHAFLDDPELAEDFKRAPAAKSVHHAHPGGLCEHTLSVMRLANRIADQFPMADRDLMIGGSFLHDVGKVRELVYDRNTEYSDEGRLVGHLVMTAQWIHARAAKIEGFPKALEVHLTHIVLSHHGALEFGSPRLPQTLEAMLVHYLDELDSRVSSWLEIMQRDPNENWTDFQKLYDRHLYKGISPTIHAKAPVERRHRKQRRPERPEREEKPERAERPPRPEHPAPEGAEAAAQKPAEARPAGAPERREKRERPEKPGKKEEKLTFKPFAALTPTAPEEAAAPAEGEQGPSEPRGNGDAAGAPEAAGEPQQS